MTDHFPTYVPVPVNFQPPTRLWMRSGRDHGVATMEDSHGIRLSDHSPPSHG
jgi:hypothetical protein